MAGTSSVICAGREAVMQRGDQALLEALDQHVGERGQVAGSDAGLHRRGVDSS